MKLGLPQTPQAKGDIWSAIALIVLLSLVARFALGATNELPQAEFTRSFTHGGSEMLRLRCVPADSAGSVDFCELTRSRNGIAVAALPFDVEQAKTVVSAFVKAASVKSGPSKSVPGSKVGWIVKLGEKSVEGKSTAKEPAPISVLQALFVMESALQAEFYK